jgi:hypothetical protein
MEPQSAGRRGTVRRASVALFLVWDPCSAMCCGMAAGLSGSLSVPSRIGLLACPGAEGASIAPTQPSPETVDSVRTCPARRRPNIIDYRNV